MANTDFKDLFVTSKKPVDLYRNPGESVAMTVPAGGYIGRIAGMNSKKNWLRLTPEGRLADGWLYYTDDLQFRPAENVPPLSTAQKLSILKDAINAAINSGALPPTAAIGIGATSAAASAASSVGDILKNLTTPVIIILSLLVLLFIFKK